MPKRLTVQQLDRVMKTDPQRGLNIIEQRADRRLASPSPAARIAGQVTQELVAQARGIAAHHTRKDPDPNLRQGSR